MEEIEKLKKLTLEVEETKGTKKSVCSMVESKSGGVEFATSLQLMREKVQNICCAMEYDLRGMLIKN